jgi:hypothetical protein
MEHPGRRLVLKGFMVWNVVRAGWMTFYVLLDFRTLAWEYYKGLYVGIGIDRRILLAVAAMPIKFAAILAGFRYGRLGDIVIEILAAAAYWVVAVGIWRGKRWTRYFAVVLGILESLLLVDYLTYAIPSPLVPDLRPFAVSSALGFLGIYSFSAMYLLLPSTKKPFGDNAAPEVN